MRRVISASLALLGMTSIAASQSTTSTQNAIKGVTCPPGTSTMVIQLDPDYADAYDQFASTRQYPATMFYANTAGTENSCTPAGALFAFQFQGPGTLDKDQSTYTISGVTLLDAGAAMTEAHKAIDAALNPDPNKEAQNLIDVLNGNGNSGLGQAFADSITVTPELQQIADTLKQLSELPTVPIGKKSQSRKERRDIIDVSDLDTTVGEGEVLTDELTLDLEIGTDSAAIPVAGEIIMVVVAVVALIQIAAEILPGPDAYRSFSDKISWETTFYMPWVVNSGPPGDDTDLESTDLECSMDDPGDQNIPEKQLPGQGPCQAWLKNILWNQPKVDWSKEIGETVNVQAMSSKLSGTLFIHCEPHEKKYLNGKYWQRLYPQGDAADAGGNESEESDAAGGAGDEGGADVEANIPNANNPPAEGGSDKECVSVRDPSISAKPYFTLDLGGEYSMLGEAYLEVNFGIEMNFHGGSFTGVHSGTPGFIGSLHDDGNGSGLAGIDIYSVKATGEQLTAMLGLKALAGVKFMRGDTELWDMGLSLTPGVWFSGAKEQGSESITVAPLEGEGEATTNAKLMARQTASPADADASSTSTSTSSAPVSTPTTFRTVVSSSSTSSDPTTQDQSSSSSATTPTSTTTTTTTDSEASTTTTSSANAALDTAGSLCIAAIEERAALDFKAFIKVFKKTVYQQDIIPKSISSNYLTLKAQAAEACAGGE